MGPKKSRGHEQDELFLVEKRRCTTCDEIKSISLFFKNKQARNGYSQMCKPCQKDKQRKWQKNNVESVKRTNRKRSLKYNHGLTLEEYEQLLRKQDNKCAICETSSPGTRHGVFHVDHNYETGYVRGLLCHPCNLMLGNAKDNLTTLNRAVQYLKDTNDNQTFRGPNGLRKIRAYSS